MNAYSDLRGTYGWRLSAHARQQAKARGVPIQQILEAIANPTVRYTSYHEGPGRWVYKRGDLAIVAIPATKTIVTVLWDTPAAWTSHEFRIHMSRTTSATAAVPTSGAAQVSANNARRRRQHSRDVGVSKWRISDQRTAAVVDHLAGDLLARSADGASQ